MIQPCYGDESDSDSSMDDNTDQMEYPSLNPDFSMPGSVKEMVTVLVTGFGPFEGHPINASWEAVKELKGLGVAHNVKLIIEELPVNYVAVKNIIPKLWETHKPQLVVHVGVSGSASEITIECKAHNEGYKRLDIAGCSAPSQCYRKNSEECIRSGFDTDRLRCDVNESSCLAMAVTSENAGRYLCEYVFYASLCQDRERSIFIHVPPLDSPYSAKELAHGLQSVIVGLLKQLDLYRPLHLSDMSAFNQLVEETNKGVERIPGSN